MTGRVAPLIVSQAVSLPTESAQRREQAPTAPSLSSSLSPAQGAAPSSAANPSFLRRIFNTFIYYISCCGLLSRKAADATIDPPGAEQERWTAKYYCEKLRRLVNGTLGNDIIHRDFEMHELERVRKILAARNNSKDQPVLQLIDQVRNELIARPPQAYGIARDIERRTNDYNRLSQAATALRRENPNSFAEANQLLADIVTATQHIDYEDLIDAWALEKLSIKHGEVSLFLQGMAPPVAAPVAETAFSIGDKRVVLAQRDIVNEPVDAVVSYTTDVATLFPGADTQIQNRAGPALIQACWALPVLQQELPIERDRPTLRIRCRDGEAVVTTSGNLALGNLRKHVIHAPIIFNLLPVVQYVDAAAAMSQIASQHAEENAKIAISLQNVLTVAHQNRFSSIAIPLSGRYRNREIGIDRWMRTVNHTLQEFFQANPQSSLREVRLIARDEASFNGASNAVTGTVATI